MSEELKAENALEPVEKIEAGVDEVQTEVAPVSSREEVIARLQEMVSDISLAKRPELESLKQVFYKLQKAAQEEQIAAFVAGGGTISSPRKTPLRSSSANS